MNRKAIVVVALLAVAVWVMSAQAEVKKGEFLITPIGSYGLPLGDYPSPAVDDIPTEVKLGEEIQPGFGLAGQIDRMLTDRFSVGLHFGLNVNNVDEKPIQQYLDNVGLDSLRPEFQWRTVQIGGNARWYFQPESRANPFIHFGAGLFVNKLETDLVLVRSSGTENKSERSESFSDLGVALGPGMLVRISKDIRLSLEAILNNIFTEDKSVRYVNFSVGMVIGVTPQ